MSKTPLKKIIKSKIRTNKELTPQEKMREKIKYEIAEISEGGILWLMANLQRYMMS